MTANFFPLSFIARADVGHVSATVVGADISPILPS
jgi:hypothetical protein